MTRLAVALIAMTMIVGAVGWAGVARPTQAQDGADERITALETRVAELEAAVFGQTQNGTPQPPTDISGSDEIAVEITGDRIVISGGAVTGFSEEFPLTASNWFYSFEATGTGYLSTVELVEVNGSDSETIVYDELPIQAAGTFTLYEFSQTTGVYVLTIDAADLEDVAWTVVLSTAPIR